MPSTIRAIARQFLPFAAGLTSLLAMHLVSAQVPPSGSFTATEACAATQAIRGGNPGNVKLTVGTLYEAVGFNSARRQYVLLRVPGASPAQRWVRANCGTFSAADQTPDPNPSPNPDGGDRPGKSTLLPFFDNVDNPVPVNFPNGAQKDMSPPAPALNAFDYKVMALCGANFDDEVAPGDFRRLLTYYPDLVRKLRQVTDGELKPGRNKEAQLLDDMTDIWFRYKGFKHIFCGEKDGKSIGGLHFYGRYIDFQAKGIAGRITRTANGQDAKEEVVDGSIYSFGAAIVQGGRVIADHPIKGYSYVLNAQEILVEGTKAFKLFETNSKESVGCLHTVRDPQAEPFQMVFVKKDGAVRTFYPDATPDTKRNKECGK